MLKAEVTKSLDIPFINCYFYAIISQNGDHKRLYRKHFFLSRIALIYSFMGPTEIESNNTMKDEIIRDTLWYLS